MKQEKSRLIIETSDRAKIWEKRMLRIASSSIKWTGLPYSVDTVYLEYLLARNGSAILVLDKEIGTIYCGQNASTGVLDIYGYPTNRSVIFRNGAQQWYDINESVIIYNNSMRNADLLYYKMFADDLANIDMAVRVNINSQKTMPIIPTNQQQALTIKNLYQSIEENYGMRMVDGDSMDVESFKASLQFDNRKSFTADNMIVVQREIWNRCLTFIGINNVNVEKRERVNTFETNSNLDEIAIMRRDRINSRERACQEIKMKWGIDVSVDYYSNLINGIGGDGNGAVYNTSQDNP